MKRAFGWVPLALASMTALLLLGVSAAAQAADRSIAVAPAVKMSWEFPTHTTTARLRPSLGVGFWQRASGAAAGVGSKYVSALEYQLPEAAPQRVRSASFQFSGRPSQCNGNEPVVIEVSAYAADGKPDVADARAGSRVAQLSADCSDRSAFARPIDVTAIVRQQSVASGLRFVGFNIRKAINRQGPSLFELAPGTLTVVLADQPIAGSNAAAAGPAGATATATQRGQGATSQRTAAALPPVRGEKPQRVKRWPEGPMSDR